MLMEGEFEFRRVYLLFESSLGNERDSTIGFSISVVYLEGGNKQLNICSFSCVDVKTFGYKA